MSERKEKFTQGPWRVTYNHTYEGFQGLGIIGTVVCVTIGDVNVPLGAEGLQCCTAEQEQQYHTAVANARLIAAAPEMYAELKDLLDAMEAGLFPQAAPGVDYPAVMEKKWELRKLLKKARGEE